MRIYLSVVTLIVLICVQIPISAQSPRNRGQRVSLLRSPKTRAMATAFRNGKLPEPLRLPPFARYPKGVVSVTVRNDQPFYKQSQASAGVFIVYVAGAAEPQQITLPPGATKTLVFNQVADFGKTAQAVVAIWGNYRWFTPGVDVRKA